ncbi:PDZ domain-containing protein [Aeoliella mucimassa]|uniref:PDZ domain-containing protein n=1 Tax=Aeoliella mucimassa TaxID=2527972 RepID=A0A518AHQ4_9BACT|nr:PDZ domain-containing protein [Aeoliella mucimassa]QDU54257.1 hypothetical protein Pan181_04370 [Aeoliella mucimassa]
MSRFTTFAALVCVAVVSFAATSSAQTAKMFIGGPPQAQPQPRVQPFVQPVPDTVPLPAFGFQSYNIAGYGERVTHVNCYGRASQLGLEPGDTILTLNGIPLTYHGSWNQALYSAMQQGGSVTLAIRDVRSGAVVYRTTYLGGGVIGNPVGPITPKSMPVAPPTLKHQVPKNSNHGHGSAQNYNPGTTIQVGNVAKVQLPNLGNLIKKGN